LLISIYTVQLFEKLVKTNEEVNEAKVQYVGVVLDLQKPGASSQNRTSLFQKRCCRFDNDIIPLKKGGTHEHIDFAPGSDYSCLSSDTGDWSGNWRKSAFV
jgi:hypothetical protein